MICEKCGFEYTSERCPVCAVNAQGAEKAAEKKSKIGLIGMILAIASFALKFFVVGVPELPLAIAGLICSVIGKQKNAQDGYATAGLAVSIIKIALEIMATITGLIVSALIIVLYIVFIGGGFAIAFSDMATYF